MKRPLAVTFVGSSVGSWHIERVDSVRGDSIPLADRLAVLEGTSEVIASDAAWALRGVTSNERYVTRYEQDSLVAIQPDLGRAEATRAALIPIRKSETWWALPQDERRAIFEERSHHTATGMDYLPAVARRLHHCRDLGESFDFLTWFEYAPEDAEAFEELVGKLRNTEEWAYVEREVDIRLSR